MNKFINKAIKYIDQRFVVKYLDNKFWQLADENHPKISEIFKKIDLAELSKYYNEEFLEIEKSKNEIYIKFREHLYTRYLYKIENCIIEPKKNWVVLSHNQIFKYSYPLIEDPWDVTKPRPSALGGLLKGKTKNIEKGIFIKYGWSNYYHFFIDTLAQVYLCDEFGIENNIPIIVPYYYNDHKFIQEFFSVIPLKRNIIVQSIGEFIKVKELYVCKDIQSNSVYPKIGKEVARIINSTNKSNTPEYIYIKRKKGLKRNIKNALEIENMMMEYGFTIIEPGDLEWKEQVKLFSNAKKIVGIHGAGFTNIIFCQNRDLKILEIFPGNGNEPEHYENICTQMGFGYESISGKGLDNRSEFTINEDEFKMKLQNFLKN